MLRLCINGFRNTAAAVLKDVSLLNAPRLINKLQNTTNFSTICNIPHNSQTFTPAHGYLQRSVLFNLKLQNIVKEQSRTVTKFTLSKGKRKTVKAVLKRFYRLDWGIWIRTKAGRNRRLWRKSQNRKRKLRQHVFTNATQSNLLDKMVSKYWRRPKYWVDNPYEPYNTREEFPRTSMKPRDYWRD